MLVAPLMTPLMGIGLSIVQGNSRLAAMTIRTASLGFLLSFVLALGIGLMDQEFGVATDEMRARHWPSLVDLSIAFIAGIAAAYASGRPGLLAALPGVAIAASLVPPIASSGLALSIGHYVLAIGAMLLFLVNVVAIVFASAATLWAVGLRNPRGLNPASRLLAASVSAATIATTIWLALSPPRYVPPLALIQDIESVLDVGFRLRKAELKYEGGPVIEINVGGSIQEHPEWGAQLTEIARKHLGEDASVRLRYGHETMLR